MRPIVIAAAVGLILILIAYGLGQSPAPMLIEVDNQSGRIIEHILVQKGDVETEWPGVAPGQSALISFNTEAAAPVSVQLLLKGRLPLAMPMARVPSLEAGQRLYIRLEPSGALVVKVVRGPGTANPGAS